MMSEHISEFEIQQYLDNNLDQDEKKILEDHLSICRQCRTVVEKYKTLYTLLADDTDIQLSNNFTQHVLRNIEPQSMTARNRFSLEWGLGIIGVMAGLGMTFYFYGIQLAKIKIVSFGDMTFHAIFSFFQNFQIILSVMDFTTWGSIIFIFIILQYFDKIVFKKKYQVEQKL